MAFAGQSNFRRKNALDEGFEKINLVKHAGGKGNRKASIMAKAHSELESWVLGGLNLPLELLQTFVLIAEHDGDAAEAGRVLGISQPSMSRRISALRERAAELGGQPWLLLKGKKWLVTSEGQRVLGVVTDLLRRVEQAKRFIAETGKAPPVLSVACDQGQAVGLVGKAVEAFLRQPQNPRVRLAAPASKARIEGVAAGNFDFALVTEDPVTIFEFARVELYVEELYQDRFLAVTKPSYFPDWRKHWEGLPIRRHLRATDLVGVPLVLTESGSRHRRLIEDWYHREVGLAPEIAVEVDSTEAVLRFALAGTGVGIVTKQSLDNFLVEYKRSDRDRVLKSARKLADEDFPPVTVRLIARRLYGRNLPDLRPEAKELWNKILELQKDQLKPDLSLK
jgi:DNA-binding transcriptional LysR family regulator